MTAVAPIERASAAANDISENITRVAKVMMAMSGIDQKTLAARIGKDPTSVNKIIRGQREWALADVVRLAEVLDLPIAQFFEPVEFLVKSRCFAELPAEQLELDFATGASAPAQLTLIAA